MIEIACYKGIKKKMLNEFEGEQWPIADRENFGVALPNFRKDSFTIVALEDSKIVGFIFIRIDMGVVLIDSLLVHDSSRRRGVGKMLLEKAESKAKNEGCHIMKLETGKDWNAVKFYEKHGYTIKAELNNYYGKGDYVLMDKKI